jgi:hypothetical protein
MKLMKPKPGTTWNLVWKCLKLRFEKHQETRLLQEAPTDHPVILCAIMLDLVAGSWTVLNNW